MKYLESYGDRYLFDDQKVDKYIKDNLKYKEGDTVYIKRLSHNKDDCYEGIVEIIFVRKFSFKFKFIYGVTQLGQNPDYYFEIDECDIIRKVKDYEISTIKYNL